MTAILSPTTKAKFWDNNGVPLAFGKLTTYAAGTTTPLATYVDSTQSTQNANPIILNFRGECDLWVPPNVSFKYALTDSLNNPIPGWPIDNIVSSQLITLYGGVDGGSANAYILTFTANFTAYTDGIVIYWIPSNTNTTGSTINVNGLGVVNILNPDGSALSAGEIIANQPAQILFKSGAFQLITPAATSLNSFAATWGGFSTPPAQPNVFYRRTGYFGAITIGATPLTGVSNATTFSLSGLPAIIRPTILTQTVSCVGLIDNGANVTTPSVAQILSTGVVSFFKDLTLGAWTASGNKGFAFPISLVFPL
jgi:hypothetical protein